MRIAISRVHHPVTVLGPGRRAGIWMQGCSIRCSGCASVDTWGGGGPTVEVDEVLRWLAGLPDGEVDGVTISGGEPTDQPAALAALLAGIGAWRAAGPDPSAVDVLVFTGRHPEWLETAEARLLDGADAVVAGPYVAAHAGSTPLRGSENQRLVPLTALGRDLYQPDRLPTRRAMQVEVDDDGLWMIGIPLPGDLPRLQELVERRGVRLKGLSWLS